MREPDEGLLWAAPVQALVAAACGIGVLLSVVAAVFAALNEPEPAPMVACALTPMVALALPGGLAGAGAWLSLRSREGHPVAVARAVWVSALAWGAWLVVPPMLFAGLLIVVGLIFRAV